MNNTELLREIEKTKKHLADLEKEFKTRNVRVGDEVEGGTVVEVYDNAYLSLKNVPFYDKSCFSKWFEYGWFLLPSKNLEIYHKRFPSIFDSGRYCCVIDGGIVYIRLYNRDQMGIYYDNKWLSLLKLFYK